MSIPESKLKELIAKSHLEVTYKFEVPPKWLEIVNEEEHESAIFGTYGNFSAFLASPKVGKTTAAAIPIAAHISKRRIAGFQTHVPIGKENALWIDTEQGRGEAVNTIKTICNFSGNGHDKQPDGLFYHTFREYGHELRVEMTEYLIQHTPNLGIVVIDGIRDLINSINDEREATFIVSKLLKWSEEGNIHIITILHQNKGDGNARGHLGTELMNKAETVVNLSKEIKGNERQTIVEPKYNRHKEFKSFGIVLRNNEPQIVGVSGYVPENPKVDQLTSSQIKILFGNVFDKEKKLTYSPLCDTIKKNLLDVLGIDFGIDKSKKLVKWLKDEKYLNYDENARTYQSAIPIR